MRAWQTAGLQPKPSGLRQMQLWGCFDWVIGEILKDLSISFVDLLRHGNFADSLKAYKAVEPPLSALHCGDINQSGSA